MRSPTENQTHLDERIIQYIEIKRINVNGIYDDIKRKKEFLRDILGYARLRTGKDKFVSLDDCEDTRISIVVKGTYTSAKKDWKKLLQLLYNKLFISEFNE